MNTPTYKESYDKIIRAYFKEEIKPFNARFCFCGTLCNNSSDWYIAARQVHNDSNGYSGYDFVRMEKALLETLYEHKMYVGEELKPEYENALFNGMCAALEVLKQIHIERGENIEEQFEFKKRELVF